MVERRIELDRRYRRKKKMTKLKAAGTARPDTASVRSASPFHISPL